MKEREKRPTAEAHNGPHAQPALKTFWHYPYASLVKERRPSNWDVVVEKILSLAPRAVDLLLLRRKGARRHDHQARVMRGMWPLLTDVALLEFKGPTRGLRPRDLVKLLSYGWEYSSLDDSAVAKPSHLSLVLAVPKKTPVLLREYDSCALQPQPLGGGYVRLTGSVYTMVVVLLDQVADAERDDFLRLFTHDRARVNDPLALRWAQAWIRKARTMQDLKHLEGFDDLVQEFIDSLGVDELLQRVTPEQRLAGLDPEQRLAGLDPAQVLEHYASEQHLASLDPEQLQKLHAALDKKLRGQ
ncbi:MAG: hypothetical protein MJE77_29995 [Proteobacteria bacterium]|nr:hypothetical protein [Pseudomonadota bacterium]